MEDVHHHTPGTSADLALGLQPLAGGELRPAQVLEDPHLALVELPDEQVLLAVAVDVGPAGAGVAGGLDADRRVAALQPDRGLELRGPARGGADASPRAASSRRLMEHSSAAQPGLRMSGRRRARPAHANPRGGWVQPPGLVLIEAPGASCSAASRGHFLSGFCSEWYVLRAAFHCVRRATQSRGRGRGSATRGGVIQGFLDLSGLEGEEPVSGGGDVGFLGACHREGVAVMWRQAVRLHRGLELLQQLGSFSPFRGGLCEGRVDLLGKVAVGGRLPLASRFAGEGDRVVGERAASLAPASIAGLSPAAFAAR